MDDQNKNLILASVLSFIVIITWFILFPPPEPVPRDADTTQQQSEETELAPTADTNQTPLVILEKLKLPLKLSVFKLKQNC